MSKSQLDATLDVLSELSLKQLQEQPGLSKDRADLIVAGGLIIQTLMEATKAPRLLISGNGLREGLFYEYLYGQVFMHADDDVLLNEVNNLMRYYHVDEAHSRHVSHLSLRLFDELASIHAMGRQERTLLMVAAHLHDVGVAVSFYDWQVHTAYILLHSKISGLSHRERLMVAHIASFRNKKKLREMLAPYRQMLEAGDEETLQKLGILLLMARALDRALSHDIRDLTCRITDKRVHIMLQSNHPDIRLELKEASEFQQRFEKLFGRDYTLEKEQTDNLDR
jgi:exopolyphosphatase/guanosine-5'-triphosphate,3'-diphosphate pyrophosphatase